MLCSDPTNKMKHWFVLQRAHNGPSVGCTGAQYESSIEMLFWKDVGNGILLDCLLPFKRHQSYRPLPRYIQEINPEIWLSIITPNTMFDLKYR